MFQEVPLRKMGQMQFISPQMGPSMSPAFAFATAGQQAVPDAPQTAQPSVPPEPMVSAAPPTPPASNGWIAPVVVLGATVLIIGLTI